MVVRPVAIDPATPQADLIDPVLPSDRVLQSRGSRRSPWYLEVVVIAWLMWVYDLINNLAPLRQAAATSHGQDILHLEAVLYLDPEQTLDRWLSSHHTLSLWVADYYDNAHFVVTLVVVVWMWWRHCDHYRRLRTSLILVNVIGFVVYWFYPTAPPRLLPGGHIADVVTATGAFGSFHDGGLAHHANEFAAMPSLHMAWAMWSALAAWEILRRRHRWAAVVWLYPLATALATLATGNHYVLDLVAGMATLALAVAGYSPISRTAQHLLAAVWTLSRRRPVPQQKGLGQDSTTAPRPPRVGHDQAQS